MPIPPILRLLVLIFLSACLGRAALGAEESATPAKSVQYKRAGAEVYAKGDVLKADPEAVILPPTAFAQNGDLYNYTPKKKAPKVVYLEQGTDWVEPITPPDMPASLNIAPDAMQIREPQGDVQAAMPSAPTSFAPVANAMPLPNGAVIKTGANGSVAILFGGVFSARLMPDSEAAVQQTVTKDTRSAEVDLTAGGVFSKVGTQVGVKSDYQVHTHFGTALAQAGDFATVALPDRTDIWVSQGTVELLQPDGKKFGTVSADGTGPLKLIRFPAIANAAKSIQADAESLTAVLNFIPLANQKLAALHAKAAQGTPLTANEEAYLHRIKQVPELIKLELIIPPPATIDVTADGTAIFESATLSLTELRGMLKAYVPIAIQPYVTVRAGTGATYAGFQAVLDVCKSVPGLQFKVAGDVPAKPAPPPPPPAPPAPPKPLEVVVHADGSIKFQGATLNLDDFAAKIKTAVAATPEVPVILHSNPKMDYAKFEAVVDACKAAPAKELTIVPPAPQPPPPAPPPTQVVTTPATPTPGEAPPAVPADIGSAPKIELHGDGKIVFQNETMGLAEFQAKMTAYGAANPQSTVVLQPSATVANARLQAVIDACKKAHLQKVIVTMPPPAPPEPLTVIARADGSIKFQGETMKIDEFTLKIKAAAAAHPELAVIIHSNPKMDYGKFEAVVDACKSAPAKEVDVVPPAPQPPAPAPAVAATPAGPAAPIVNAPAPAAPAKPVAPATVLVHEDGSVGFLGKRGTLEEFKTKLAAMVQATPARELIIKAGPKVAYDHIKAVLDACADAHVVHVTVSVPPPTPAKALPVTAETPPTPEPATPAMPVTAETPPAPKPAPVPVNTAPVPAELNLAADGTLKLDGAAVTEEDLKAKLADLKKTNPKNPLVMMKQPGVTKEQWMRYVTLCHTMGLKLLVKNAKGPEVAGTPPVPRPAAAEGGPGPLAPAPHLSAAPAPETAPSATDDAVPVEIELTPDGQISFLGEAVSPDDLKARLETAAQTHAKEVVIVKDEKVTHDQWQKVVDLCHAAKLKVKLKTVKSSDMGALKPRAPGAMGIAALPPPSPAGHATPAAEKVLPIEIGLAAKGRLTFEGTAVSLDELKSRLGTVAKGNPGQPVLIVKASDVSDDSADALVALCQGIDPSLKINVKAAPSFTPPGASMDALNTNPQGSP